MSGEPLPKLLGEPQPWNAVRYWLMDLSYEISIAEQDGTLPKALSLDRIWVTADGRAKLLDFPAPGTSLTSGSCDSPSNGGESFQTPQQFLFHVAASALHGRVSDKKETCPDETTLPLPGKARMLIDRLATGQATSTEAAAEFQKMTRGKPSVTRLRRVAMVVAIAFFPMLVAVFSAIAWLLINQWNEQYPEMAKLRNCLMTMDAALDHDDDNVNQERRRAFEIYIAGTFRETIEVKQSLNSFYGQTIPLPQRAKARRIIADYAEPSEQELRDAAVIVEPILDDFETSMRDMSRRFPPFAAGLLQFVVFWVMFVAVPGLIAAIAFRRGLMMRLYGVDYVIRNGRPASRLRMFWRSILFNSPVLLGPVLLAFIFPLVQDLTLSLLLIVCLVMGLTLLSLMLPKRGVADRLSGTNPVPS